MPKLDDDMRMTWGRVALALLAVAVATPAAAQVAAPSVERAPGNVELPEVEARDPLVLQLAYTGDILSSVAGGRRRGTRWINNVSAIASADLDTLAGLPRTNALLHVFYNDGTGFSSDLVGDGQIVSSIEAGVPLLRVLEGWVEHRGPDDRWSFKAGLYDVNSEFDTLQTSLLFVNSAFGMGTELGASGRNGPSTFPSTSLALRGQVKLGDRVTLRAAAADGVPNDPARPRRDWIGIAGCDGALLIGEADVELGVVRLLGGGWTYTARSDDRFDAATGAGIVRQVRSNGAYVRGEAQLAGDRTRGMRGFFRLGVASDRANLFGGFSSLGFVWRGLLASRPRDDSGIAVAYAGGSSAGRAIVRAEGGTPARGEAVIELNHRIAMTDWLGAQPHVQYVVAPGLNPTFGNALVLGLRLTATIAE
ncbi:carbohydrate porin [uncultured Sphingomonas sp.]|uniref:carbohydrate porin n=1 Tax=uncultured Sphingomonas sp. TaxID=158754 RepID=UPI0025F49927|nr:carbohydrate porin [uncultured Sphingomonas sp.]